MRARVFDLVSRGEHQKGLRLLQDTYFVRKFRLSDTHAIPDYATAKTKHLNAVPPKD